MVAEGGAVCNINSPPTAESLRTLMTEARFDATEVTMGVMPFLKSGVGGWVLDLVTGGQYERVENKRTRVSCEMVAFSCFVLCDTCWLVIIFLFFERQRYAFRVCAHVSVE